MWYTNNKFHYKTMDYQNSCFPCSLHIILANLGYVPAQNNTIETLWNGFHNQNGSNLNMTAPNEGQVHEYISKTPEVGNRGVVFSPTMFGNQADTQAVRNRINQEFIQYNGAVGMIFGIGHAEVFYKYANTNQVIHYKPSTIIEAVTIEEFNNLQVNSVFAEGQGAIQLLNRTETIMAGQFIMIIK